MPVPAVGATRPSGVLFPKRAEVAEVAQVADVAEVARLVALCYAYLNAVFYLSHIYQYLLSSYPSQEPYGTVYRALIAAKFAVHLLLLFVGFGISRDADPLNSCRTCDNDNDSSPYQYFALSLRPQRLPSFDKFAFTMLDVSR